MNIHVWNDSLPFKSVYLWVDTDTQLLHVRNMILSVPHQSLTQQAEALNGAQHFIAKLS